MVSILLCSFIAQQCSMLSSLSLTVLFIAGAKPWQLAQWWHYHHMVLGPADTCMIKGDDFTTLSCGVVNTKNWYRKDSDLWAEFGKEMPFGRKLSSKHSVKVPAVGSTSSFGRRVVLCLEKTFGNTWWRGLNIRKGRIDDGCKTDIGAGALMLYSLSTRSRVRTRV
jgi:hypothetical protein